MVTWFCACREAWALATSGILVLNLFHLGVECSITTRKAISHHNQVTTIIEITLVCHRKQFAIAMPNAQPYRCGQPRGQPSNNGNGMHAGSTGNQLDASLFQFNCTGIVTSFRKPGDSGLVNWGLCP